MLLNKVHGGSEKVTIDGEKVRDKLNLKTEKVIIPLADIPFNQKNETFGFIKNFISNDTLYTMGTSLSSSNGKTVYQYEYNNGGWINKKTVPFETSDASGVMNGGLFQNEIYFNGYNTTSNVYVKDYGLWKFNSGTKSWSRVTYKPLKNSKSMTFKVTEDKIYDVLIKGTGTNPTDRVLYIYENSEWVEKGALPISNNLQTATSEFFKNEYHILGGYDFTNASNVHYKFDGESWTKLPNMPVVFPFPQSYATDDFIHIYGGYTRYDGMNPLNSQGGMLAYVFDGEYWTKIESPPFDLMNSGVWYDKNKKELNICGVLYTFTYMQQNFLKCYKEITAYKEV